MEAESILLENMQICQNQLYTSRINFSFFQKWNQTYTKFIVFIYHFNSCDNVNFLSMKKRNNRCELV